MISEIALLGIYIGGALALIVTVALNVRLPHDWRDAINFVLGMGLGFSVGLSATFGFFCQ